MALVFQLCETCGTRYGSRTVRSKHCSSACRQTAYRASKQQRATPVVSETPQQNQMKSHEGNNEMKATQPTTTVTPAPLRFTFSESHYQLLCANAKVQYLAHVQAPHSTLTGAIVEFQSKDLVEAIELYHIQRTAGWLPMETGAAQTTQSAMVGHVGTLPSIKVFETPLVQFVSLYLRKPLKQQQADLEIIYNQIRVDYERDLEAEFERELDLIAEDIIEKQDKAAEKAREEERLARKQTVREEHAAEHAKRKAELIKAGRLAAEGKAQ